MTEPVPIDVEEWGEDGEWLLAPGHVDPEAFLAAADLYVIETWYTPGKPPRPEALPSAWGPEPRHVHYRPIERPDVDEEAKRCELTAEETERLFTFRDEEGWRHSCEPDHPKAEPWTEIRA